jgi:hypothetical protein
MTILFLQLTNQMLINYNTSRRFECPKVKIKHGPCRHNFFEV